LGCLDVHLGMQLANIGNMTDVQLNPAPRNAFGAAQSRQRRSKELPVQT